MKILKVILFGLLLITVYVPSSIASGWNACVAVRNTGQCADNLKSKAAADAFIRQTYPSINLLTDVKVQYYPCSNSIQVNYNPPIIDAKFTDWLYINMTERDPGGNQVSYPAGWLSSETDALAQSLARVREYRASACLAPVLVEKSPWLSYLGGPTSPDCGFEQLKSLTYRFGSEDADQNCTILIESMDDTIRRAREINCGVDYQYFNSDSPSGYSCKLNAYATVTGPLTECDDSTCRENVGNPINISNGNKTYGHLDLQFDGVDFTRAYRSSALEAHDVITKNWTHNFSSQILNNYIYIDERGAEHKLINVGNGLIRTNNPEVSFRKESNGDWTGLIGKTSIDRYDTKGFLLSRTYPDGKVVSVIRNSSLAIIKLISSSGRSLSFDYNPDNSVARVAASDGSYVSYAYDSNGILTESIFSDGSKLKYSYEDERFPGLLTAVIDENNAISASYSYDEGARGVSTASASSKGEYNVSYDDVANTSKVVDPMGMEKIYGFLANEQKLLSSETYLDPNSGQLITRQWERSLFNNYLVSRIIEGSKSTSIERDPSRKLIIRSTSYNNEQRLRFEETDS